MFRNPCFRGSFGHFKREKSHSTYMFPFYSAATPSNIPMIVGAIAAAAVATTVVVTLVILKVCAKSAVSSVPSQATYNSPQVSGPASYNNPPGSNPSGQGPSANNGRGVQDGPKNTKAKVKLPEHKKPPSHLTPMSNAPQPPASNNGLWLDSDIPALNSILGQFPSGNANVPGPSSYMPSHIPSAPMY